MIEVVGLTNFPASAIIGRKGGVLLEKICNRRISIGCSVSYEYCYGHCLP